MQDLIATHETNEYLNIALVDYLYATVEVKQVKNTQDVQNLIESRIIKRQYSEIGVLVTIEFWE